MRLTGAPRRHRQRAWRGIHRTAMGRLTTGLAALILSACQSLPATDPMDSLPALAGDYFALQSAAAGGTYHIHVRLPPEYDQGDARYPVVYVLDGDSLFPVLAANHLFLTYDDGLPEVIVVGIAYGAFDPEVNRRGYDFSAPAPDAGPDQGGAPAFHRFLEHELIPAVEARYRADPERRILFGQSRGGYLVLYSAYTDPDRFWGRIASNPVFDPGRQRFFSPPAQGTRADLGLVVTSGSEDNPGLRQAALEWFAAMERPGDRPWAVHAVTIEGGTHAADSTRSYRQGMGWLFRR